MLSSHILLALQMLYYCNASAMPTSTSSNLVERMETAEEIGEGSYKHKGSIEVLDLPHMETGLEEEGENNKQVEIQESLPNVPDGKNAETNDVAVGQDVKGAPGFKFSKEDPVFVSKLAELEKHNPRTAKIISEAVDSAENDYMERMDTKDA
ncbi:hypothetical protein PGT21_030281 [Puccinia graminis f. sp. tritici]|uniref:Uncharacterized protein n=1 Tax=Puccinia graminis f. sp. tritici TaxID=56615 RepID=A0A5B0NQR5_PUCGR|nr:hypothetical protein PGTUg99_029367 [Puccinia graminis f. sp. tritici]KAA1091283.1 hypothetical protein PGT21_030281 [Puccinia graminis f. sp. tritici]